jgi:hypothetical protein
LTSGRNRETGANFSASLIQWLDIYRRSSF